METLISPAANQLLLGENPLPALKPWSGIDFQKVSCAPDAFFETVWTGKIEYQALLIGYLSVTQNPLELLEDLKGSLKERWASEDFVLPVLWGLFQMSFLFYFGGVHLDSQIRSFVKSDSGLKAIERKKEKEKEEEGEEGEEEGITELLCHYEAWQSTYQV